MPAHAGAELAQSGYPRGVPLRLFGVGAKAHEGYGDVVRLGGGADKLANAFQDTRYHFIQGLAGTTFEEGEQAGIAIEPAQGIASLP